MGKSLDSLFTAVSNMTDEQLRDHIAEVRRRKYIERPAAKKRVEKAEKPERKKRESKVLDLVRGLSPDQLALLLGGTDGQDSST